MRILFAAFVVLLVSCQKEPTFVGTWKHEDNGITTLYYIQNMLCKQIQNGTEDWTCNSYMLDDDKVYINSDVSETWTIRFSNDSLFVDAETYQMVLTKY